MAPILAKHNRINMSQARRTEGLASVALIVFLALLFPSRGLSQAPAVLQNPYQRLPQETGVLGLNQELVRLQTTARLMQVVAHPDDEDGGMLTLESRGHGDAVLLMTLTHGEGGQNKLGSNLFDELGVLRTLELTASDRYYGVEQRFSHVADFGYSKNPEETFEKWHGHDIALGDIVRVIRTFHPDVLIARFSGTERDGHGHHQASAILTKEAFRAAADPKRFPEQIAAGLAPWQPKKLYIGNVCGFGAMTCPAENYTVRLNTGVVNPALGVSYVQFAMEGLRHQLSQGAGGWSVEPGDRFTYYKLVDSVLPPATDKDGHEKDFFDGIDTSLPGLASRLGDEEKKVPQLRPALLEIADQLKQAASQGDADPNGAVRPLLTALESISHLIGQSSDLSTSARKDLLSRLQEKEEQIQAALNLALYTSLEATAVIPDGISNQQNSLAISPGQKFVVHAKFHNRSKHPLSLKDIVVDGMIPAAVDESPRVLQPGRDYETDFQYQLPSNFPNTRPGLHRNDPERDSVYTVDEPQYATLPFAPPPFRVIAHYDVPDLASPSHDPAVQTHATFPEISTPVVVPFTDEKGQQQSRPLNVTPIYSVMLEPGEQIIRVDNGSATTVKVGVSCNLTGAQPGKLRLEVPAGWRVQPDELPVQIPKRGDKQDFEFKVFPESLKEGEVQIRAALTSGGKTYSEGYSLVTREDLESTYYFQPAIQRVSIVDVKIPRDLKIGYIMGAGDDIPTVLKQIGLDVTLIPAERLGGENLSRYGTIVLGIRAYNTQKDVVANNQKLLDYVSAGGTLIAQYDTGVGDFNSGHFTPFPAQLSRARVSVEEAPVEILAPDDPVLRYPNQIAQRDFDGWVQERGLYFMNQWDSNFKPLLSCHDPGEQPQKGGLLKAQYGKGVYIYNAYAFFRQLPAGVPGAIRLYVNLLSAGHRPEP
ncbi:MAG TPA: PIG-L family deacetylase [Terriglobales bacterium]|nr:PIG-L family deacetylase [Terriglobales bacterium]